MSNCQSLRRTVYPVLKFTSTICTDPANVKKKQFWSNTALPGAIPDSCPNPDGRPCRWAVKGWNGVRVRPLDVSAEGGLEWDIMWHIKAWPGNAAENRTFIPISHNGALFTSICEGWQNSFKQEENASKVVFFILFKFTLTGDNLKSTKTTWWVKGVIKADGKNGSSLIVTIYSLLLEKS